jgi:membrane fusion protein (multidrug efflux system)
MSYGLNSYKYYLVNISFQHLLNPFFFAPMIRWAFYLFSGWMFLSCGSGNTGDNSRSKSMDMATTANGLILSFQPVYDQIVAHGSLIPFEQIDLTSEVSGRVVRIFFREGAPVSQGELLVKMNDDDLQARWNQLKVRLMMETSTVKRLNGLKESGGISLQALEEAETKCKELEAELDWISSQIKKTEIRAPWNGVVGIKKVSEGAVISTGMVIATLRQTNNLKVSFHIPEKYAHRIKEGQGFEVMLSDNYDIYAKGKVRVVEPGIDVNSRSISIQGVVANGDQRLKAGQSVRMTMVLDTIFNAIVVPDMAIKPVMKGQELLVLKNGIVEHIPISIGVRRNNLAQVSGNIFPGDTILVSGLMQAKQGKPARIVQMLDYKDFEQVSSGLNKQTTTQP